MKKLGDYHGRLGSAKSSDPSLARKTRTRASTTVHRLTVLVDYEHVEDDSEADAQAMDVATREEATALDQNMDSHADQSREREEYRAQGHQKLKSSTTPDGNSNSALDQAENNGSFIGSNSRSHHLEEVWHHPSP
jgi:hypothetical protein